MDQVSVERYVTQQRRMGHPEDRWFYQPSNPQLDQPFLLVFQSARQRAMLEKYGSTIVGMDATYKTSKWGFPLFLMNVVTNHGKGYPVALFFVQEETGTAIASALEK